ncbi:MAG: hypothetical protein ABSG53_06040 [Thermoguttaceae bacterium]|jgi:hypothetical protein
MVECSRCFVVPFTAFLLAAASVRAQDSSSADQPPSGAPPVVDPWIQSTCGPRFSFQADWLWTTHANISSETRNFIDGPDAASFDDLPGLSGDNGYRLRGEARLGSWIVEGVYSDFGGWDSWLNRNVDGVAFNANSSSVTGNWVGRNYINPSTYFAPINRSASITTPVNTINDQFGLGPNSSFATDPRPSLMANSNSDFHMSEANVKWADYLVPTFGHGLRLGVGYVNADFNQDAWVALSGTFRDVSPVNGGIPNSALTAPGGGNLFLYAGGGTGFSDGILNGTGIPSQVLFTHRATTSNNFNGAQVLLDGDLLDFWRMDIGTTLKAGVFDNFAQGSIIETYSATNGDLSAYGRRYSDSRHELAFMGGIGLDVGYHVTDEIAIRVGYDILFLSNLALSQEQVNGISGTNSYHVQTDGTALIQSAHAGLEIAF